MKRFAALVLVAAVLAGCKAKPSTKPETPATPTTPAPVAEAPVTPATPAPTAPSQSFTELLDSGGRGLTLDDLRTQLEQYLNADSGAAPRDRLSALLDRWGVEGRSDDELTTVPLDEVDLDGDGARELVATFNTWGEYKSVPSGAVFVISTQGGKSRVDMSEPAPQPYLDGVALMTARTDLTGDGKPEIVWAAVDHGAHTTLTRVLVSRWQPGRVETLPGDDMVTTMAKVKLDGDAIVMTGGTVGSAGAGLTQREATLTFRWSNGGFVLADRRFAASEYGYHRLLDALNADLFGRHTEAQQLLRSALEPGRDALPAENVPPEWQERFGQAVTEFARFRLAWSLLQYELPGEAKAVLAGAKGPYAGLAGALAGLDPVKGCSAAGAWAQANPEFLQALNSPYGYNNYRFEAAHLCGYAFPELK